MHPEDILGKMPDAFFDPKYPSLRIPEAGWQSRLYYTKANLDTRYFFHRNQVDSRNQLGNVWIPNATLAPVLVSLPLGDQWVSCGYQMPHGEKEPRLTATVKVGDTFCRIYFDQSDVLAKSIHGAKVAVRFSWSLTGIQIAYSEIAPSERQYAYSHYQSMKRKFKDYSDLYSEHLRCNKQG